MPKLVDYCDHEKLAMPFLGVEGCAIGSNATEGPFLANEADFNALEREAERLVKDLDIPPCPAILVSFNQEFHSSCPDLKRLATLIGTDIGLSAAMMKTVNSPFYGLSKKATSVDQAISILGIRASANLVSRLMLRQAFPTGTDRTLESFWDKSTRIAGLAAAIAEHLEGVDSDEAHTYVLFRDCGMLVMLRKFAQYADLMELGASIPGAQVCKIEDTRFKFNHARVARALVRSWSLPDSLCESIFLHHEFEMLERIPMEAGATNCKLIAFGLLAEQIASLHLDQGICPDWIVGERFVLDTLNIAPDAIVELTRHLRPTTQ